MRVRFYVDPSTGRPHIHNHDVSEEEVVEVLEAPGEDRPGREDLGWPSAKPRTVVI